MGLFDTVYVSSDVAATWHLHCRACGRAPGEKFGWQTRSLESCMHSYFLRHDESGAVRLYLLDRPSDRRYWRPWTKQEIEASERVASEPRAIFEPLTKKAGEGCFLPDAYRPEHRRQRFMGELPLQWMEIYGTCECGQFVEWWIKFCDGVASEFCSEPPTHPAGFFDDGELDL